MSKIRILSEHLANRIAAGEVVERPASVVKELVENSLDAGATRVSVEIEGGGTRLIRVADNGEGMDGDDVLLSVERHATSKLREESSLDSITTLGFRGEALPSIGSVSRLVILSRQGRRPTGSRAELRYGTLHDVHEAGCAPGTVIEVRSLFGNVPARKKFLKSARTELHHIEEVLRNLSLANVRKAFTLQVDGRKVLDFPARTDLAGRVEDVFTGQRIWLTLDAPAGGNGQPGLEGFILQPDASSSRTSRLRILVNSRSVHDRLIGHAVKEGLRGFLMKGQVPAGVLLLSLNPGDIDVNVHPAKQEIRFRQAGDIHSFIVSSLEDAVGIYQEQLRAEMFAPRLAAVMERTGPAARQDPPAGSAPEQVERSGPAMSPQQTFTGVRTGEHPASWRAGQEEFRPEIEPPIGNFQELRVIGRLFDLYLLAEKEGRLLVIDQHAAHERILYQQLCSGYLQKKVPKQRLLFPVSLELGPSLAEALEENGSEIERLGFAVEPFGEQTWVVKAVPALTSGLDPQGLLLDVLAMLARGSGRQSSGPIPSRIDHLLATMACKAAVKAGSVLEPEEIGALLARMDQAEQFSHCPHGRPVLKQFSRQEIAQWFKRT